MLTLCRVPRDYIVVSGFGQSSFDAGADHYETGAYDLALLDAGIENFNVIPYTSVLPPEAREITQEEALPLFHHGAVLECIKAQTNGTTNERITAGIGRISVYEAQNGTNKLLGGFAAEYEGNTSEEKAKATLTQDLDRIFHRRYGGELGSHYGDAGFRYENLLLNTRSHTVDEDYGTVLVALCFLSYILPPYPHPTDPYIPSP